MLELTDQAKAWLELAEEIGCLGHWRMNIADHKLTWSAQMFRIYGLTPETYTPSAQTAGSFYHPHDFPQVARVVEAGLRTGIPYEFTARIVRPSGEIRHIITRGLSRGESMVLHGQKMSNMGIGVVRDITIERVLEQELHDANMKLEQIARQDALTGLANRRHFDQTLAREWRRAQREATPLSLAMIDVDRFKLFNDHYGHQDGDTCLQQVARAVSNAVRRPGDFVARYGGEELAVILPGTDLAGAETVAHAVRYAVEALGLAHEGNLECGGVVTVTIGVASAHPPGEYDWVTAATLITEGDKMLYRAKRAGRNRVLSV
jgi:diguanylate cyclase (GGDEF)-like protein